MEKTFNYEDIGELKKDYEEVSKKYEFPEFDVITEDFDIDKIIEKPANFLVREIRRAMNEKISAYLHLFETFANPSSPPVFVFNMLKNAVEEDREVIMKIYKNLSQIEIDVLKLDTIYNEKKEAEFIKKTYEIWQKMKKEIYDLLERLGKDFKETSSSTKGYFG